MIIGRRVLIIDTPASTLDDIKVTSIVARFNEGDESFRDASVATANAPTLNHHYAIKAIGENEIDWSEPRDLTEDECNALLGGRIMDLAQQS